MISKYPCPTPPFSMAIFLAVGILFFSLLGSGFAAEPNSAEQVAFFESKIRPVLVESCYECHNSAGKKEGGLALDFRDGLRKGGDRGAAIVVGKGDASLLVKAIRHQEDDLRMPQGGPKIKPAVVADFVRWINTGAADPRDKPPSAEDFAKETSWEKLRERRKQWWSFQPLRKVELPQVTDEAWRRHPVDCFVRAKLDEVKLEPVSLADRNSLIRRLTFTITGLPPTIGEIEDFVNDKSPDAYEKVVDRLLRSPRFGERWARHWMDWFRYAESHGSEGDTAIPYAWRYRDYLIRAMNADVPYDQMIREHVAGDLLPKPRLNVELGINESALGTGHYRMVQHGFAPTDALDEQIRFTDNQIDVLSKAVLGLTVSCARCHHHKFDPISQHDFYALYGIMASCRPGLITVDTPERQAMNRDVLTKMKGKVRGELANVWEDAAGKIGDNLLPISNASLQLLREERKKKEPDAKGKTPVAMSPLEMAMEDAANGSGRSPLHAWIALRDLSGDALAREWRKLADNWRISANQQIEFTTTKINQRWDLSSDDCDKWFKNGNGLPSRPTPAGEFHITANGPQIVSNVYPAGVYTHGLSTKHNGVLNSPRFRVDGDEVLVKAVGQRGAIIRYVVQNYPRVTLLYPSAALSNESPQWFKLDTRYWKGEHMHIEIVTGEDRPTDATVPEGRSWFGVQEVLFRGTGQPSPPDVGTPLFSLLPPATLEKPPQSADDLAGLYSRTLAECIRAWRSGEMTNDQAAFLSFFVRFNILPNTLEAVPKLSESIAEYRRLEAEIPLPTRAPGVWEGDPFDQPLFVRGNQTQPAEPVARRFLEVFDPTPYRSKGSGRLELAASLSDPRNPLVSRVIVNRIWHHVFGSGLVETPDNFGRLGEEPTHPELLDFLAASFSGTGGIAKNEGFNSAASKVMRPWSMKDLIRSLVLTRTFQLSCHVTPRAAELDPGNDRLSYFRLNRLEAEEIRDSILAVTGLLDGTNPGPGVAGTSRNRSIYVSVRRNSLDPFLSVFDAPEPSATLGRREATNVPAQSLAMLNDPSIVDHARQWSDAILRDPSLTTDEQRFRRMFYTATARQPSATETQQALQFVGGQSEQRALAQRELERLKKETTEATAKIEQMTHPLRARLLEEKTKQFVANNPGVRLPAVKNLPAPIARWEFDVDLRDSIGSLHGRLRGPNLNDGAAEKSVLQNGALVVEGQYVETPPLGVTLHEKTMEAWVQLDNLVQRGGGVMTVESLDGATFDSIAYGEKDASQWLAGSNFFSRTIPFKGTAESEATQQPVHVAIVYSLDGTITAYRNGRLYGTPYRSSGLVAFDGGKSHIVFGLRHSPPGGNKMLQGRIFRAQLYDRALTADEIEKSATGYTGAPVVTDGEILASLSEGDRAIIGKLRETMTSKQKAISELERDSAVSGDQKRYWQDLAQSLLCLKEFLYLR